VVCGYEKDGPGRCLHIYTNVQRTQLGDRLSAGTAGSRVCPRRTGWHETNPIDVMVCLDSKRKIQAWGGIGSEKALNSVARHGRDRDPGSRSSRVR
jgi:hypothetical protein